MKNNPAAGFELRFFDCKPMSASVMKVADCRAKRKLPLGLGKNKSGIPIGGQVMPLVCRDCALAADLEAGEVPTRSLAEIVAERGDVQPPPWTPRKKKPRSHPSMKMPEGRIHEPAPKPEPPDPEPVEGPSPPEENAMEGRKSNRERITEFMRKSGPARAAEIVKGTGIPLSSASSILSMMKNDGLVTTDAGMSGRNVYALADSQEKPTPPADPPSLEEKALAVLNPPAKSNAVNGKGQFVKQIRRDPENAVRLNLETGRLYSLRALEAHIEASGDTTAELLLKNYQGSDRVLDAYLVGRG